MPEPDKFECWGCGACCKIALATPEFADLDRGDGRCMHLTDDNKCAIYEDRPEKCRLHVEHFSPARHALQIKNCKYEEIHVDDIVRQLRRTYSIIG